MNKFFKLLVVGFAFTLSGAVNAGIINFLAMADGTYGEGAWNPLNVSTGGATASITGMYDGESAYAYLDSGKAGLGVCKQVDNLGLVNTMSAFRTANNCNPSSDDNVSFIESLHFVFDSDVVIENIWFNNNHDGGFDQGDMVTINGGGYAVSTGYAGGSNGIGVFNVMANTDFYVAFNNEQFYISAIEFRKVAEPGSFFLLALGLIALFGSRRRT